MEPTPAEPGLTAFALTRVPDLPRWIDTRGMLLSGRAAVYAPAASDGTIPGAVVVVPDSALASIVTRPSAETIADVVASLSGDVNVLARVRRACHRDLLAGEHERVGRPARYKWNCLKRFGRGSEICDRGRVA